MPSEKAVERVALEMYLENVPGYSRDRARDMYVWLPFAARRQWLEKARHLLELAEEADRT